MRSIPLLLLVATSLSCADEVVRPSWACDLGSDSHGTWADLKVGGTIQRMRYIPAGVVQMPRAAGGSDAMPVAAFWLADSECTEALRLEAKAPEQRSWVGTMIHRFTDDTGTPAAKLEKAKAALREGGNLPADGVPWMEIDGFIKTLAELQPTAHATLPSEMQLEYASRTSVGDLAAQAWYDQNSAGSIHPVKTKQPNALGIYDLRGNLWEWCVGLPRTWREPKGMGEAKPLAEAADAFPAGHKGANEGRIVAINPGELVLRSFALDAAGSPTENEVDLRFTPKLIPGKDAQTPAAPTPAITTQLKTLKVGDRVNVVWHWDGGRKLDSMSNLASSHLLFGGSFKSSAEECAKRAYRDGDGPGLRLFRIGFRFCLPVQGPVETATPAPAAKTGP